MKYCYGLSKKHRNLQKKDRSKINISIYTSDIPRTTTHTRTRIYADDTAKASTSAKADQAVRYQLEIEDLEKWTKKW